MKRFLPQFRRLASPTLLFFLISQPSPAQERPEREPDWIPSLSFQFDTFDYKTDNATVNLVNPPANQGAADKTDRELLFLGGAELQGPVLFKRFPGRPRPFLSGCTQFDPFSSDEIFRVGDLQPDTETDILRFQTLRRSEVYNPRRPPGHPQNCLTIGDCPTAEVGDFVGQGSQIEAQFQPSWCASFGAAFSFPLAGSLLLHVKPAIAYNVDRIEFRGDMKTVTENAPSTWVDPNIPEYTIHQSSLSQKTTDHSLGPGIEVALSLFREARPLRVSLFADARFLWLLSDRTTSFADSVASYEVRRDPFGIRAGAGVRLSWMGLGGRR